MCLRPLAICAEVAGDALAPVRWNMLSCPDCHHHSKTASPAAQGDWNPASLAVQTTALQAAAQHVTCRHVADVQIDAQAADLIVNILKAISNSRPAIAQAFLDLAALVLQQGEVERVLYRLADWARTADPSLMRHFIFKVLEACAPPYSSEFAAPMIM